MFDIKNKAPVVLFLILFISYCSSDYMATRRKIIEAEQKISEYKITSQKNIFDSIKYPVPHNEIEQKEYIIKIQNDYEQLLGELIINLRRHQNQDICLAILSIIITLMPIIYLKTNSKHVGIIGVSVVVVLFMLIIITLIYSFGNILIDSRLIMFTILCIWGFQILAKYWK